MISSKCPTILTKKQQQITVVSPEHELENRV